MQCKTTNGPGWNNGRREAEQRRRNPNGCPMGDKNEKGRWRNRIRRDAVLESVCYVQRGFRILEDDPIYVTVPTQPMLETQLPASRAEQNWLTAERRACMQRHSRQVQPSCRWSEVVDRYAWARRLKKMTRKEEARGRSEKSSEQLMRYT